MEKKKLFNIIAAGLFLVAIVLWFALPAVQIKDGDTTYTFLDMTFGRTEKILGFEVVIFKFSFLNLLAVIFLFAGLAVAILRFLGKGLFKGDAFLVLGLGVAALVLLFLTKQFVMMSNDSLRDAFIDNFNLTGAIAVAVLAGVGGGVGLLGDFIK